MLKSLLVAVALGSAAGIATSASAGTLLFSYSEPGGISFSFDQSSAPTPLNYGSGSYTDVPVTEISSSIGPFSAIQWYSAGELGQFDTDTNEVYVVYGPQIYTGPESNPVFAPGVFAAADQTNGLSGTLTVSSVPEPATWASIIAGIGGIGLMLRRARKTVGFPFKDALSA